MSEIIQGFRLIDKYKKLNRSSRQIETIRVYVPKEKG